MHVSHFHSYVFIFFSGQDAFDYFKNEPKLFDVVCYVLFSYFVNVVICQKKYFLSCQHIGSWKQILGSGWGEMLHNDLAKLINSVPIV